MVWVSEYQWTTPIGLGVRVPMNNPQWFGYQNGYQNTNEQPPLVWVSEYQWTTPIGLGIRVPMNDPHWFRYQNTNEWPPLARYQSTNEQPPLVWVSKSIHSQFVHNHIYEITVSNKNISYSSTYIYIYNHIFSIQIYLWYFYILYFKSI